MGSVLSMLRSLYSSPQDTRTVMIGLESVGKTTILYQLVLGVHVAASPTYGFNAETITHNNFKLNIWDVCGHSHHRPRWRNYFENVIANGLIFVVDSNDRLRIRVSKDGLWRMLQQLDDMGLQKIPLLVYANKQDFRFGMTVAEIRDALELTAIQGRRWHIVGTSAVDGYGLKEGLDWYVAQVKENW